MYSFDVDSRSIASEHPMAMFLHCSNAGINAPGVAQEYIRVQDSCVAGCCKFWWLTVLVVPPRFFVPPMSTNDVSSVL